MNTAFNDVVNFEEGRIEFSRYYYILVYRVVRLPINFQYLYCIFRKMMITYREASKQKITNDMSYDVKGVDGEVDAVQVSQKITQIDAVVDGQDVATAIEQFQRSKGPGNAAAMLWPVFEDYDPDAIAQQNKFSKSNNGGAVARNDTEGTIRTIDNEGTVNTGEYQL